jgi:hypothetical protein
VNRVHSALSRSIPTEGQPISNARLVAELQGLTIAIHMFGLGHLAHISQGRAYETPKNEQVAR